MLALIMKAPQKAGQNKKGDPQNMKMILMALGYTSYQASCIAPIVWAIAIGTVVMGYAEFKGWL